MFLASIVFLSNRCTVKKVHYHVCEQILHVWGFIFLCIICLNISSCEVMLNLEVHNQVLVTYDVNFLTNQREPNLMMINNDASSFSFIFVFFSLFLCFLERDLSHLDLDLLFFLHVSSASFWSDLALLLGSFKPLKK